MSEGIHAEDIRKWEQSPVTQALFEHLVDRERDHAEQVNHHLSPKTVSNVVSWETKAYQAALHNAARNEVLDILSWSQEQIEELKEEDDDS